MMGYRSDVVAAFYANRDKGAAVRLYVDENFPEQLKGGLTLIENKLVSGYVYKEDNVKWYDSWPEVQAFNKFVANFLELAEQEEIKWAYEFVRIGEDSDDIEENRSNYADYLVYPNRSIETDF